MVFGGVNPNRFYGELDVYDPPAPQDNSFPDGKDKAYLMDFPTVRIGDITDTTTMVLHSPNSSTNDYMPFIRLNPLLSHLTLPLPIVDDFHSVMREFGLTNCTVPELHVEFCVPCNASIPEQYVLKLSFRKATISIPFQDFVQAVPGNLDLCPIFLFSAPAAHDSSLGGAFFKAAYIVLEPDANRVAIAAAVRNPSAPSNAAIKEISDGVFSDKLSTITGVPEYIPTFSRLPSPSKSFYPTSPNNNTTRISSRALIEIGLAGAVLLFVGIGTAVVIFITCRKQRKSKPMPDIPSVDVTHPSNSASDPYELNTEGVMGELEVPNNQSLIGPGSVLQELPGGYQPQELQGNQ
ncbi:hypothetical protein AOL_s00007g137 [Orbilia oligospora ATCC 24927]|uniref:Peptidase A1 domain-containing protein n=1 Tax=Arthrobotrys oligospora (strain ATCC 24927 / CBS 115.81 / DSM 1491) TaxID=756982 RepID=G1X1H8_ARTOA|nr:hypothetical protein AOL_s00007g137 [Orbilia oligospora ATCC 24927]EGX52801.1 hypothetical protein AOL_s00007g137 [Orbilia oligospora ATCC 24927]